MLMLMVVVVTSAVVKICRRIVTVVMRVVMVTTVRISRRDNTDFAFVFEVIHIKGRSPFGCKTFLAAALLVLPHLPCHAQRLGGGPDWKVALARPERSNVLERDRRSACRNKIARYGNLQNSHFPS